MLKLSCNVTDQLQSLFIFSHSHRSDLLNFTRRRRIVSCSPRKVVLDPIKAIVSADQGTVIQTKEGLCTLADQLRLGSLTEDGLSYKEKLIVRSYEVGSNKTATVETVANLLQVRFVNSLFVVCVFLLLLLLLLVLKNTKIMR